MAEDWSTREVERIVGDYFEMLRDELLEIPYSKAQHRRNLLPELQDRSEQSVEYKHTNISAVLVDLQLPYIDGYKPRGNYQRLLREGVEAFLLAHPSFFADLLTAPLLNPQEALFPQAANPLDVFVPPPERSAQAQTQGSELPIPRIDFARRDAENRTLGESGERFVFDLERPRLLHHGRDDLVKRVEWVSSSRGDGLGYDILLFNHEDDSERYVEVKATPLGKHFPFYVTANEVRVSERHPQAYHLYRLFSFTRDPRLYVLQGALSEVCRLRPTQYRAIV